MRGKAIITLLLMGFSAALLLSGCAWAGRTAGKVQAKLERKAGSLERGYDQGYQREKGKAAAPAPAAPERPAAPTEL